jgi:predicted kinase
MQVIILRGIPGCGKSTYAKKHFSNAKIVSADDFFMQSGEYKHDGARLSEAHQACWLAFYEAVLQGLPMIVVDNTNTTVFEISPYVLPAEAHRYEVKILTLTCDLAIAAARNVHGVPLQSVERMAKRLDEQTPLMPSRWDHEIISSP